MNDFARTGPSLVLGASGFIGRWVVRELTGRGTPVAAAVRDLTTARDAFKHLSVPPDFHVADLANAGEARGVIEEVRPARVFNLAAYGVDRAERDERTAERLNHGLVVEVALACAHTNDVVPPRLIHVGSALEYGAAGGILTERTAPQPTTLYGRTKLAGTLALASAARDHGTDGVTARLFTVFGDGEHDGRLFPSLVEARRTGAVLPLTDGMQRRDFTWVGDIASLLVDLAEAPFQAGETVNLASGRMHTVAQFVTECAGQLSLPEQQLQFGRVPTRVEEMRHEGVAVSRLHDLVGRTPTGDLGDAIRNALGTAWTSPHVRT